MNNDLISREYVKLFVCEYEKFNGKETEIVKAVPIIAIDKAPTVNDTIPQGKWILCEDTYFSKCSICGDIWLNEECGNYCSNCGAKMEAGDRWKEEDE